MFQKIGNILAPPTALAEHRDADPKFVKRLQLVFGRDLHVEWNPRKQRWVIEQCTEHNGSDIPNADGIVAHSQLCRRIYVWLVRDESDDSFMPLCDRVIEKLREMETYRKYGVGERGLQNFLRESRNYDQAQADKMKQAAAEITQYSRRHNRVTWNRFFDLFRRHDLRPNR